MKNLIKDGILYIKDGIEVINDNEFYQNNDFEKIYFPQSLKTIGELAFAECNNLKEVVFPNNLKVIKAGAFMSCNNLTKIVFNDELEEIYDGAFSSCPKLKEVNITNKIKRIETMTFYCCDLRRISFTENVMYIGDQALWGNENLKEVNIYNKNVELGKDMFGLCKNLKEGYIACAYPKEMELSDYVLYTILALTSFELFNEELKELIKENAIYNEKILMETIINTNNRKALNTLVKYDLIKGDIDKYIEKTLQLKQNELTALLLQTNNQEKDLEL